MKKAASTLKQSIESVLLSAMLALASCKKDDTPGTIPPPSIPLTVTAVYPTTVHIVVR